jgi:hypothetical protein
MHLSPDPWIWVGAVLTLCIFSFLYKENPFYRFAEHLFVGVSNGYSVTLIYNNVLKPDLIQPVAAATAEIGRGNFSWALLNPANDTNIFLILPACIGMLYIARFIPRISWLVRFPIALTMGYYISAAIPRSIHAQIIKQVQGTILTPDSFTTFWISLGTLVIFIGTFSTVVYFFFSVEHKGVLKPLARIGIFLIMIGFGASFGLTIMGRVALAIGRFIFLFHDWLGWVAN